MLSSFLRLSKRMSSDMLKPRLRAVEMLKRRVEEKSKKPSAPINSADITIIGNNSLGYKPCIIVSSEGNGYLFNCSSGTQRLCFMSKIRVNKLENVFITNRIWENVAGSFGLSLTLQDMGSPSINVHSTSGISGLFEACRNFMYFNTGMVCLAQEAVEYKDHSISIVPIELDSNGKKSAISHDEGSENINNKRTKFSSKVLVYLCTLPDLPGALDPLRCKELKVPVGPMLGKLKSGLDVTLPDGRTVRSEEVCSPKIRGKKFLIVDCPGTEHIEPLISNIKLESARNLRLQNNSEQVDYVIHLSPTEIIQTPAYQKWMQGFPGGCKHFIVTNDDPKVANFIECYRYQYILHQLDEKLFPLLYLPHNLKLRSDTEMNNSKQKSIAKSDFDDSMDDVEDEPTLQLVGELEQLDRITLMNSFDKISIRPKTVLETLDAENSLDIIHREAQLDPHYEEELKKLRELQAPLPEAKDYEPELIFLGTGSAIPSKVRNTSCILMNFKYPRSASVIMDCGEDSYGQLLRHYGPDETARVLKQLDFIYISHHHTDHHVGMVDILRHRSKLTDRTVTLLLPPSLDNFMKYHNEDFQDLRGTYKVYRSKHIKSRPKMGPDSPTTTSIKQTIYDDLGGLVDKIDVVDVDHCANSCAAVIHFNINHPEMKKFTVAYSGDARPSDDFAMIGKNCDLLIHEATFDDRSIDDAMVKKHSTSAEAIQMGILMNAKFTILTHFSQRIPKIPYFTKNFDDQVGFAFDNLTLRCPSYFCRLPIMKPILSLVFKKSLDDIDMKYLKSEMKLKAIEEALKAK